MDISHCASLLQAWGLLTFHHQTFCMMRSGGEAPVPLLRRSFERRSLLSWAVLDPSTLCHLPGSTVFWTSHCVWTEFLVTGLPGGTTSHILPASVYLMPSQDVSPVESEHTLLMVHGRLQALCPGSNENSIPVIQGPPLPTVCPIGKEGAILSPSLLSPTTYAQVLSVHRRPVHMPSLPFTAHLVPAVRHGGYALA